jgi:hypothetical protein
MTDRPKVDERSLNIFAGGRRVTLPMPASAINKIVELLKIPDKEKEGFGAFRILIASFLPGTKRSACKDNLSSLRRIAALSKDLLAHLKRLNPPDTIRLRIRTQEGHLAVRDYVTATRTLTESAALLGKQKRPRNRPSGSVKSSDERFGLRAPAHSE